MNPITAQDPLARSLDVVTDNTKRLQQLFPEAFTEGKVDMDVLRELLGESVDEREEKYGLNWHGKRRARQTALTPSSGTLRPVPEDSVDWESTENLLLEGDNLEVLKLLQKSYAGQVKLIYIDPPYNTGKDFVYPDNFQDSIKNYQELTGQTEGGRKISSNNEASGRFHTDWLNMMYPRLKLAKNLLQQDGVMMVSCDDNEVTNLRIMLDEVFGEENFIAQMTWQRSKKGDSKLIATVHEYVICYVRDKGAVLEAGLWRKKKEGVDEVLAQYQAYREAFADDHVKIREAMSSWYRSLPDSNPSKAHKHYNWSDDRGLYFAADFAGPDDGRASRPRHDIFHPITGKPCKKPSTGWRWDEAKTNWALEQKPPRIHFGSDESTIPNRKSYLEEISSEPYSSVFYRDGRSATLEVEGLIGKGLFPFPKNTDVLEEFIELTTGNEDLVLDFFAGSGSTGHAVWKANAKQRSRRRFILVQLPEPIDNSKYPSIAELTKERLRRAAQRVQVDNPEFTGDTGFRVYKLDSTNIRTWEPNPKDIASSLFAAQEHLKEGRSEQDILTELLLKLGLPLTVPIEERALGSHTLYAVGAGTLMACLSPRIEREEVEVLAQSMVAWQKELAPVGDSQVVLRDSAFRTDVAKANFTAILEQAGFDKRNIRSL